MTRNRKIFIAAAAAAAIILLIIGIASCSAQKRPETAAPGLSSGGYTSSGYSSCVPPMACGPHYAGYVPPYYAAHPSFIMLTPYSSYYAPSFNGRSYTAVQTPIGRAPVTTRTPMPYPPGYKPVPGDFQPPKAPVRAAVPSSAPRPSFKAPDPVRVPAVTTPKYTTPKFSAPKFTAPKPYRRK